MDLLLLAIAPVTIIILYIYFKDKFEKEPISFLFKNFLLGATASILITAILGTIASKIFPLNRKIIRVKKNSTQNKQTQEDKIWQIVHKDYSLDLVVLAFLPNMEKWT